MAHTVTKNEIGKIFELMLKKMEIEGFSSIEIDSDNYWYVSGDEALDLNSTPEPIVGSLLEDWELLQKTIASNEMTSYLDFDRISSILKFISEKRITTS